MAGKDYIAKQGWGSRTNFQASYGLKMTPENLEEGNQILEATQATPQEEHTRNLRHGSSADEAPERDPYAKGKDIANGLRSEYDGSLDKTWSYPRMKSIHGRALAQQF